MNTVEVITLIIIVLTVVTNMEAFDSEVTRVTTKLDGKSYLVLNLPDKQVAAEQLAKLRAKLLQFIAEIDRKAASASARKRIKRMQQRFQAVLSESKPEAKYTSYTVNKGAKIHMCIRERDENNRLIDENTLFFVALHELAHVMTVSIGHKTEFWSNFRYLLKQAIDLKYYEYHPYHKSPQKYCGTQIADTPLKLS